MPTSTFKRLIISRKMLYLAFIFGVCLTVLDSSRLPASAAPNWPGITTLSLSASPSNLELRSNEKTSLVFTITNSGTKEARRIKFVLRDPSVTGIKLVSQDGRCISSGSDYTCGINQLKSGGVSHINFELQADSTPIANPASASGSAWVRASNAPQPAQTQFTLTRLADNATAEPTPPTTVDPASLINSISGSVTDHTTTNALAEATVVVADQSHRFSVVADQRGTFNFTSTPQRPIQAGQITIKASKVGYISTSTTIQATAGQQVSGVSLALSAVSQPSSTGNAGIQNMATGQAQSQTSTRQESSSLPFLLIAIAISLLIVLGVFAVILWKRYEVRKIARRKFDMFSDQTIIIPIQRSHKAPSDITKKIPTATKTTIERVRRYLHH